MYHSFSTGTFLLGTMRQPAIMPTSPVRVTPGWYLSAERKSAFLRSWVTCLGWMNSTLSELPISSSNRSTASTMPL